MCALLRVDDEEKLADLTTERIFVNLAQRWYPPSSAVQTAFQRRGETLKALYESLRTVPSLRFLSQQIYSGWRGLVRGMEEAPMPTPAPDAWLPRTYPELRAGFYFCNRLISLMEDVYHDLHLEEEHCHPDNRGWMNLFNHWSSSRMFRTTWTVTAANCGARFQNFCARHLGLDVGRVELSKGDLIEILYDQQSADSPLTSVEWHFVRSFVTENFKLPDKAELEAELELVQIFPREHNEGEANQANKPPPFTVGFAILRKPRKGEHARRIVYFRVRDHMRRMGMARRGLFKLFAEEKQILDKKKALRPADDQIPAELERGLIEIDDSMKMPEEALQKDEEAFYTLFHDLYRGVRIEFELNRRASPRGQRTIVSRLRPNAPQSFRKQSDAGAALWPSARTTAGWSPAVTTKPRGCGI